MSGASDLDPLRLRLAKAAQEVYDDWEQDENGESYAYGSGGICDDVALALWEVLYGMGYEDSATHHYESDNHTVVIVKMSDGVWEVDIPLHLYERGSWYAYKKVPNVTFTEESLAFTRISKVPADYDLMTEDE